MVLHSRGCGRVARRRFTRWASRSSLWLPGGPFFHALFPGFPAGVAPGTPFLFLAWPSGRPPPGSLEGPFLYPTNLDHAWNHVPAVNPKKSGPAIGMRSGFSFSFRSNAGFPWKERPTKGPRPWESSPAVGAWPYLRFGFPERHDSFGGTLPSVRSLRFCGARTLRPPFPRRRAASARRPMP